ncbi:transglycosylase SLT domain-containing protein [Streptomyces finlayi]|uniref:Transglycosylase SLT domain-containing protein n=1 Tax=Streptomyces finlayi TaxID=67296 RepID=A0A7G7BED8_9ACTN|nr:lytic transglycosylase domain-containing protein [Streptomyces finlayi]QNE73703.1 transglycosylase SLT domain-containing protein [Streptomyces finlayi]
MRINGTMRRGLTGTATAVAAMAALTASQAPGFTGQPLNAEKAAAQDDVVWTQVPNDDSYHTELPPLKTPEPPPGGGARSGPVDVLATRAEAGIPATVLAAYRRAEAALGRSDPGCNLPWQLLAAIGKVESGQASGGRVDSSGTTLGSILGPVLDGVGFANISDTDDGAYDGDARYDRAVGPMQFIPSTWAHWGKDGNGDGRRDPDNIYDASLAAGHYLCAGTRNLNTRADLDRAILSYNHSDTYLRTVLSWLEYYRQGAHPVDDGEGPVPRSPGPGGPAEPKSPVGGPGAPASPGGTGPGSTGGPGNGGGGIVVGPQPTTPPPLPTPPGPSRPPSPSPDPTETGPMDPGPDPTDSGSPSPSPSPTDPTTPPVTPSPTTPPPSPDPDPTTTAPACPTDSPSPDPSDTTAPGTGTRTGDPDPCAGTAASAA